MALKTCTRPAGSVGAFAHIQIRLSQDTVITASGLNYLASPIDVTALADGSYSVSLQATADLTPTNTYYTVTEFAGSTDSTYTIQVPNTAGPFVITTLITNPPTANPTPTHVSTLVVDGATGVAINAAGDVAGRSFTASSSAPYTPSALAVAFAGTNVSVLGGDLYVPQPSGDTTGTTDTAAIAAAMASVTAYWATIQATLTPPQFATPLTVKFWAGAPYYLTRRVLADQKSGGIFLRPGVSIDFQGATFIMQNNAAFVDTAATDLSPLSATVATVNADIALGAYTVQVVSSAGFAVNNPVFCRFGDAASSNVEVNYWLFAYVAAIPDGTHITLDRPVSTALSVAGVTNAVNKTITLMAYELRDFDLKGPATFLQGSAGAANSEMVLRMRYCRNFTYSNLTANDPGAGIDDCQFCEDVHGDTLAVVHSSQQLAAGYKGRVLGSKIECANVLVENVRGENFAGTFAYSEFGTRNYRIKNARAVLTNSPAPPVGRTVAQADSGAEMFIENIDLEGDFGGSTDIESLTNGGVIRWRNVHTAISVAPRAGIMFRNIDGDLSINQLPSALIGRWRRISTWSKRIGLLVNTASQPTTLPSGLLRRVLVYCNATTGITNLRVKQNATNNTSLHGSLVAGQWIDLGLFNSNAGVTWGTNNPVGDGGYNLHTLLIGTDGTLVAGTWLTVLVEYFAPPADLSSQVTDDASLATVQDVSPDFAGRIVFALTDAGTVTSDWTTGDYFTLSTAVSRVMGLPSNLRTGDEKAYEINNTSGGTITPTWPNAAWKLVGGAGPTIGAGKRQVVRFLYNGANLVEIGRSSGDI